MSSSNSSTISTGRCVIPRVLEESRERVEESSKGRSEELYQGVSNSTIKGAVWKLARSEDTVAVMQKPPDEFSELTSKVSDGSPLFGLERKRCDGSWSEVPDGFSFGSEEGCHSRSFYSAATGLPWCCTVHSFRMAHFQRDTIVSSRLSTRSSRRRQDGLSRRGFLLSHTNLLRASYLLP